MCRAYARSQNQILLWAGLLAAHAGFAETAVWTVKGRIVERYGSGQRIVLQDRPSSVAVTSDGTLLYVTGSCSNAKKQRLRVRRRSGTTVPYTALPRFLRAEEGESLEDVTLSASGRLGALVARPCGWSRATEASEMGGVLVLLDLDQMTAVPVKASVSERGLPVGVAMAPQFSPDERFLLVSYETGFDVVSVASGQSVLSAREVPGLESGWSTALGWISSRAFAYKSGRDYRDADRNVPNSFDIGSRAVKSIPDLLRLESPSLLGLTSIAYPKAIRRRDSVLEVVSLVSGKVELSIPRTASGMVILSAPRSVPHR